MSQKHPPEPFGYFKAEPFGWTDCAETDEGAQPLYDQRAIDDLIKQRDELALIIATDTGTESAVAELQHQCDELWAGALRYRWLRSRGGSRQFAICEWQDEEHDAEWYALGMTPEAIDAAIDAAITRDADHSGDANKMLPPEATPCP